jgi:hypothetical protein
MMADKARSSHDVLGRLRLDLGERFNLIDKNPLGHSLGQRLSDV